MSKETRHEHQPYIPVVEFGFLKLFFSIVLNSDTVIYSLHQMSMGGFHDDQDLLSF